MSVGSLSRSEWLEARRKGIGGTDAPAIFGLSRYRTAIDVWEDKLGVSPERPQTPAMRWGLALEEAIARAYTIETGRTVAKVGLRRARHVRDFPMIGSIDRRVRGEDRLVEIKTSRRTDGFASLEAAPDLPPEKRIPADYYVQVQHYLEVAELPVADVAALFSGQDFRIYEIPRDAAFGADLRAEEGAFWRDYVVTGEQPPVTGDDLAFLARRFPVDDGSEVVATPEIELDLLEWLSLSEVERNAAAQKDAIRARLEAFLGERARLLAPGVSASWKAHQRTTVGWKEIASVYRSALERIRAVEPGILERAADTGDFFARGFSADLDVVEGLYTSRSTVRPFRIDRKEDR